MIIEMAANQHSDDPFLSMLNKENKTEIESLKEKINFIDEGMEFITDEKTFWILTLLRDGYTAEKVKQLIPMSSKQFYQRCDEGIDVIRKAVNADKTLKGGDTE